MTDPNPDAWGPMLVALVRSILEQLQEGRVQRAQICATAARVSGAKPHTVGTALSQLGHLGVVDRAEPRRLRLTVLGRPWAEAWLQEHAP